MGKICMLCAYVYFMSIDYRSVGMCQDLVEKLVKFFQVLGVVAGGLWAVVELLKELASIPWEEWAANGVIEHLEGILKGAVIFPASLFLMWIVHRLVMYGFHKLWPDDYDEWGHHRKPKPEQ